MNGEPRTRAGDVLLTDIINDHEAPSYHVIERVRRGILDIEAEASGLTADELAFALGALNDPERSGRTCQAPHPGIPC